MRKLAHLSTVLVLGALGAYLSGCPIWDANEGGGGDGGIPVPTDTGPRTCTSDRECPQGYCNTTARQCVTSPTCSAATPCPSSYYCDSRGLCVPGCGSNADCTAVAASLVCDTATHRCGPSGRCTSDAQCSGATPVCLGGSCQPRTNQCQFDYQCASGQSCVDGRCVVGCTAANASTVCAAGQVCTNGRCTYPTTGGDCGGRCTTGQLCVDGVCLRTCADDASCGTGNMCDHGVCRVDTRPHPYCPEHACSEGSVCFNGACRRLCPTPGMGDDGGCMRVDVQFDLCSLVEGQNLCTSRLEQHPQCARSADCSMGRACVNATCQ